MPRYEIRNTSNSALSYLEGNLPLNLMLTHAIGTYRARAMSEEEDSNIVVPALTAVIDQSSLVVGQTATVSTNGPSNVTYQWRLNGSNIGGATSASYVTAAAGSLVCRVTIPGLPHVDTPALTVTSGTARPQLVLGASTIVPGGTGTPHTHVYDTSGLLTGDRLLIVLRNSWGRDDAELSTINGANAPQVIAQSVETNNEYRHYKLYEYVMPGAGAANFPLVVNRAAGATNVTAMTVWGVRGGAYARLSWQQLLANTSTSASTSITPAVAENLLLTALQLNGDPGAVTWTGATAGHAASDLAIAIRAATRTDAPASNTTISASWPTGRRGGMLTLSIEG